ncbi:MAG: L,D-transpeptidase [Patescibacteria group bacterium]
MRFWKYFSAILFTTLFSLYLFVSCQLKLLNQKGSWGRENLTGQFVSSENKALFNGRVIKPAPLLAEKESVLKVLGGNNQPKRIEIDLNSQRLYAYEGGRQVFNFLISSGKWGRTPIGSFQIWIKLRYTKMEGGSKVLNTYYYLPNVPYVMFFYNEQIPKWRGFGIHGTYWHNNFGHTMSHGCINMKTEEAALLYYWANPELKGRSSISASKNNPGTQIIIYGKAPAN